MSINILLITTRKLKEEINKQDYYEKLHFKHYETINIFKKIIDQFTQIIKYIKDSDSEIERLCSENLRLKSELIKVQLELVEYKKK